MIENGPGDDCVPLHHISSKLLIKVIGYVERHVDAAEKVKAFDADFLNVDTDMLVDLIWAAHYLDIKSLLNLACQTARNTIPEEIRLILDDFTPTRSAEDAAATSKKTIVLKSSDGKTFEVTEQVATQWQTIKHMIEDYCADGCIPTPNVTSKILAKVIEYSQHHVDAVEKLKAFDADFMKVNLLMLLDLFMAAMYLQIDSLQELTGERMRKVTKDKTSEEFCRMFNLKR